MSGLGFPEVLVGFDAFGGGRWSIRDQVAEEEIRQLLQEVVNGISVEESDVYDLSELEQKVHFLISHAVQMGWYIHVPKCTMDDLNNLDRTRKLQVEKRFAMSNSNASEHIGKFGCPECGSNEISMIGVQEVTTKHCAYLVDGRISTSSADEIRRGDTKSIHFECRICHEQWEAPAWIDHLIDEGVEGFRSDDGSDPNEPIPFTLSKDRRS
jgi:predicted  nucleic acid-binding Zn-ribbon protein